MLLKAGEGLVFGGDTPPDGDWVRSEEEPSRVQGIHPAVDYHAAAGLLRIKFPLIWVRVEFQQFVRDVAVDLLRCPDDSKSEEVPYLPDDRSGLHLIAGHQRQAVLITDVHHLTSPVGIDIYWLPA